MVFTRTILLSKDRCLLIIAFVLCHLSSVRNTKPILELLPNLSELKALHEFSVVLEGRLEEIRLMLDRSEGLDALAQEEAMLLQTLQWLKPGSES